MTDPALTFYFAPGASSMAVHIALLEVGAEFEAKPVSLAAPETRSPAFRAINPAGLIPVLVIDGRPLTEVAGILFYLASRFPDARLLPTGDTEAQAQVVSWMSFVASTLHPALAAFVLASEDSERAHLRRRLSRVFGLAEQRLGADAWAVGEYSIADIHLFRLYFRLRHTLPSCADELPRLAAHYDRMLARPSVQRTLELEASIGYELKSFTPPDGRRT
jgi:glutathione S-transferase